MNNKGYTLIELLVAIVIIGIISAMSWPAIRRIQEENSYKKYATYGESLIASAKLYVDAYEEDLFLFDDDIAKLPEGQLQSYMSTGQIVGNKGQCVFITYQDFKDHMLVKDINIDGMTCNNENTFVRVIKEEGKFSYKYYLACGKKRRQSSDGPIDTSRVNLTLPDRDGVLPLQGHALERCTEE